MNIQNNHFAKKMALLILALTIIVFFTTSSLAFKQVKKLTTNLIESHMLAQNDLLANNIDTYFREKEIIVQTLSTNTAIQEFMKTTTHREEIYTNPYFQDVSIALSTIPTLNKSYNTVWIVGSKGNFYLSSSNEISQPNWNYKNRPWFQEKMNPNEVLFAEPYIDSITGKMVTSAVLPIQVSSETIGIIGIDIFLEEISNLSVDYNFNYTDSPLLLSQTGEVIYHSNYEQIGKHFSTFNAESANALEAALSKSDNGIQNIINSKGEREYISYSQIPTTSWTVATHYLEDEALIYLTSLQKGIYFIYITAILLLITLLSLLIYYMFKTQNHVQSELMKAKDLAEEASTAKTHFLARMSHEIRTPLNAIIGLSQLLKKTNLNKIQRDYQSKILYSSEALLRIINDILDYSKIEEGMHSSEEIEFNLDKLISNLCDTLSVFLGKKQIEFIVDSPPLTETLIGDALHLEQVLLNLCNNGVKFTTHGHVKLSIQIVEQTKQTISLNFAIEDSGIGLTKEQQSRLFTPFTQADTSTSRNYGGTGLGLVISKNLVELMGGTLQVNSELNKGSHFSFTLKFKYASNKKHELIPFSFEENTVAIIVENHIDMGQIIKSYLNTYLIHSLHVTSIRKAKEALLQHDFSDKKLLILLDMEMDDMYGEETYISLKEIADLKNASVIAMTTTFGREELLKTKKDKAPDGIIIKPLNRLNLLSSLNSINVQQINKTVHLPDTNPSPSTFNNYKGNILLAEDHIINQQVAEEILKGNGFAVTVVSNGEEVVEILNDTNWDLLLMDIHMPIMDGFTATEIIRKKTDFSHLPIIALTASVIKEEHDKCYSVGMNDIITKPIHVNELVTKVNKWIPKRSINIGKMLDQLDGKVPIILHVFLTFKKEYVHFEKEMKEKIEQKDFTEAKRMAHTLKGVAGSLCADSLYMAANDLERFLKTNEFNDHEFQMKLNIVVQELKKVITNINYYQDNLTVY